MRENRITDQIATIKDLKMVHFYRLFSAGGSVCGILAYYGDKLINLCSADEHFNELADRIAKVYLLEKDASDILADKETERFLKRISSFREDSFEKLISGYKRTDVPVMLPKAFSACYILPIIEYVLKTLYTGKDASEAEDGAGPVFDKEIRQWFGKGVIGAMVNGKRLGFPYQIFSEAGECYDIVVRNALEDGNGLKIEVSFGYDRITISYYDHIFKYKGSIQYTMTAHKGSVYHELEKCGETVFRSESECPAAKGAVPTPQAALVGGCEGTAWSGLKLPWGAELCFAAAQGKEYRIIKTGGNDLSISFGMCFCYLEESGDTPLEFGEYAFRLYERSDISELHLLDTDIPGSSLYREKYAGRYYSR
ncbi:MAG: hypothetical protein K5686_09695 [Lachnospiraceae bacterium]|nr:hypothetical protein [Lachnospiraceae bacterium]